MSFKKERFVQEYLVDLNGAAAARRAGYSERSARQTAHELLTKPDIQQEIENLTGEKINHLNLKIETVINELINIGFSKRDEETPHEKAVRLKALEQLNKYMSKNSPRTDEMERKPLSKEDLLDALRRDPFLDPSVEYLEAWARELKEKGDKKL